MAGRRGPRHRRPAAGAEGERSSYVWGERGALGGQLEDGRSLREGRRGRGPLRSGGEDGGGWLQREEATRVLHAAQEGKHAGGRRCLAGARQLTRPAMTLGTAGGGREVSEGSRAREGLVTGI